MAAASLLSLAWGLPAAAYVNYEGKQTQPVRISADGSRLFAVNTPDARLSVYDLGNPGHPVLVQEIPVGLEPVSVHPRTPNEVWVVNEVSDSVSIVDLAGGFVSATLQVKDEPADVIFANGRAFVSAARRNEIHVFDVNTLARLTTIPLTGENPRALAVSADGSRVYAAFCLSGNRTTIIPPNLAPPQPPPTVIPNPPPQVSLIVDAEDPAWSSVIQYTMPDHDVAEIDTASLLVLRYFSGVGTVNFGITSHPGNGALYVVNTDARNRTRFEPNVRGHAVDNRLTRIDADGTVTPVDLNPGIDYTTLPNPAAKAVALAQPTCAVVDPTGTCLYVAAFGSDRIARVDTNGTVLARIEIGTTAGGAPDPRNLKGPRGLALHPSGTFLYVLNRVANTITVIDTAGDSVIREFAVGSHDPTPAVIRQGRGFLYDARLSGNGTLSCASCHIDAEMDMLAWDLGDPEGQMTTVVTDINGIPVPLQMHPMKGPMVTQTLRGLDGLNPLHWRGDRADFNAFNIAFDSLLGGTPLPAQDMQAMTDFIHTIVFPPNPNQNLDRTLPATFNSADPVAGRNTYMNEEYVPGLTCNTCHAADPGPGSNGIIIPAAALQESQDFKVPHLRNVYQKLNFNNEPGATSIAGFGIVHDGVDRDLVSFLSRPVFGVFAADAVRKKNLAAFVACFDTGTAPAVGHARTASVTSLPDPATTNEWAILESQAAATNIDLIVKGTWEGNPCSLLFDPDSQTYLPDRSGAGPFTRSTLLDRIASGDILSPMGVPPGTGLQMGLDRDEDGAPDRDPVVLTLTGGRSGAGDVLNWPTNAARYVLEVTETLSMPAWNTVTAERYVVSDQVVVTNSPAMPGTRAYRLRRPW